MISVNGYPILYANYPAGETNINFSEKVLKSIEKCEAENKAVKVVWNYKDDSEFIPLAFIASKLNDEYSGCDMDLYVLYLPHARMDRIENDSQFLSGAYFLNLLYSLSFTSINVRNLHSDKILEESQVPNVYNEETIGELTKSFIRNVLKDDLRYVIVFPDKGAKERFSSQLDPISKYQIICNKERDFATGKIKGLTFETSEDFVSSTEDYNLIIVDDICSYGGTFDLAITEISKKYKFKAAYLVVSHLEEVYTKGKLVNNPLLKGIYHENTMDWSIDKPNYIEVNNERN